MTIVVKYDFFIYLFLFGKTLHSQRYEVSVYLQGNLNQFSFRDSHEVDISEVSPNKRHSHYIAVFSIYGG